MHLWSLNKIIYVNIHNNICEYAYTYLYTHMYICIYKNVFLHPREFEESSNIHYMTSFALIFSFYNVHTCKILCTFLNMYDYIITELKKHRINKNMIL